MAELRALGMAGGAAGVELDGAVGRRHLDRRIASGLAREPVGVGFPVAVRAVERDDAAQPISDSCATLSTTG